jgi:hypothetical protein
MRLSRFSTVFGRATGEKDEQIRFLCLLIIIGGSRGICKPYHLGDIFYQVGDILLQVASCNGSHLDS